LLAFIEAVNKDVPSFENDKEEEVQINKQDKPKKVDKAASSRIVPLGLRYDILKRDKFCCVLCGRVPKNHPITLQVDHINKFDGTNTVPDNLRTTCNECNNGKSDKIET
jgi:5-methylcytosine-specific restriction endonuclease McrA